MPPLLLALVVKNEKNRIRNEDTNEKLPSLTKRQLTCRYDNQHNDIHHNDTILKHSGIMLAASSIGHGFKFCHHCCWHWWEKMEKIELEIKT